MTRLSLFKLLSGAVAATLLSSCAATRSQPGPAAGSPPVSWPKQPYVTVKAYAYDCDADDTRDFLQSGGRFAKGILHPGGVQLSPAQVQRLQTAITVPQPESMRTPCYAPHHAFVFYDAAGKPVAHLEVCFTCNKHRAFPAGLPAYIDMRALASIVVQAGLPYGKGHDFYTDIYKAEHPKR